MGDVQQMFINYKLLEKRIMYYDEILEETFRFDFSARAQV